MHRFALLLTLSAGLALAVAGVAGAQQPPFPAPPQALAPLPGNLQQLETDALGWLSDLVRINTSNPPGNEAAAAQYVAAVLQKENIASEIVEMAPGRSIAIGRLQAGPLPDPSKAIAAGRAPGCRRRGQDQVDRGPLRGHGERRVPVRPRRD